MLQPDDRVLVAVSGGKDSWVLASLLHGLRRRAPFPSPWWRSTWTRAAGPRPGALAQPHGITGDRDEDHPGRDLADRPADDAPGKTPCSMCAKLRRAILYRAASELGCTKVALGHHRHDSIVTLLLNLVFSGQLKAMPPILRSRDGRHVVIRPLIYCDEEEIARLAARRGFPILPCSVCGARQDQQRVVVGKLLAGLEALNPDARACMLAALANVRPPTCSTPGSGSGSGCSRSRGGGGGGAASRR